MIFLFWASYGALWLLVLALFAATFMLYRVYGIRLLSGAEGRSLQGVALAAHLPEVGATTTSGRSIKIGRPVIGDFQMVAVLAAGCRPCARVRDALGEMASGEWASIDLVAVCTGPERNIGEFTSSIPDRVHIVLDKDRIIMTRLEVTTTPYVLILDGDGIVRAKGGGGRGLEGLTNLLSVAQHHATAAMSSAQSLRRVTLRKSRERIQPTRA